MEFEPGDEEVILEKAIEALGGEAKLRALGTGKVAGSLAGALEEREVRPDVVHKTTTEITMDFHAEWQGLSQYLCHEEVYANGKKTPMIVVVNGDRTWLKEATSPTEDPPKPKESAAFLRELFYCLRLPQLLPNLRSEEFTFTPLTIIGSDRASAAGFLIRHKDHHDVRLFFDKDSGLPSQSQIMLKHPLGNQLLTIDFFYKSYQDFGGVKQPAKISANFNGSAFVLNINGLIPMGDKKIDERRFSRP